MTRLASIFAAVVLAACSPTEVLLVDFPDAGTLCHTVEECGGPDAGVFCDRTETGCGSPLGVCRKRSGIPCEEFKPVCGCDHVTYLNECWATAQGVSVADRRPCGERESQCDSRHPCVSGTCARFTDHCEPSDEGLCFSAPKRCPWVSSVRSCDGQCLELCVAIDTHALLGPPQDACP